MGPPPLPYKGGGSQQTGPQEMGSEDELLCGHSFNECAFLSPCPARFAQTTPRKTNKR